MHKYNAYVFALANANPHMPWPTHDVASLVVRNFALVLERAKAAIGKLTFGVRLGEEFCGKKLFQTGSN